MQILKKSAYDLSQASLALIANNGITDLPRDSEAKPGLERISSQDEGVEVSGRISPTVLINPSELTTVSEAFRQILHACA